MLGLSLSPQFESKSPSPGRNNGRNVAVIPFVVGQYRVAALGQSTSALFTLVLVRVVLGGEESQSGRCCRSLLFTVTWFHPPF